MLERIEVRSEDSQFIAQQTKYGRPYHRESLELVAYHPTLFLYNVAIRLLPVDFKGEKILGIGGGDGALESLLADRGAEVIGLDPMRIALKFAEEDKRIILIEGSGTQVPFRRNAFGVITMIETLEHIPDDQEMIVLEEAHRVLKLDGWMVISVPMGNEINETHYRNYGVNELEKKLSKVGYVVEKAVYYREFGKGIRPRVLGKLARGTYYYLDHAVRSLDGRVGICECEPEKAKGLIILARKP